MKKEEIDQKYLNQHNQLEAEYFEFIDKELPSQHRVIKAGKSIDEFNQRHGQIWKNHEAEMIASGLMEPKTPPEPDRDLETEIDSLKARIEVLEAKPVQKQ